MFNVNALQKTLSAMSLPEIQKYAQLHKNDPYVVSMALSVANMKKEAQTAQQGMMGQQPMFKVAEQDIAGIAPASTMGAAQALPENVGIGQLPAQNIQGMAGGGIVAFEEGGHVPRYAGVTDGSLVQDNGGYFDPNTGEFIINEKRDTRSFGQKLADAFGYKKGLNIDPAGGIAKPPAINPQGATNARDALLAAGQSSGANLTQQAADTAPTVDTGAGIKQLAPTAAPTAAPAGAPQAGLGGFMDYLKANQPAAPESMDDYMKRREAYLGDNPTKKQMERIDKQEAQALADKEDAKAMAIIKAGLGMMAGTSQHAFTNIGQGASAGLEDYITSQKDAKKLQLERDKMRDAVENAAYAYKKGDMDSYEKYAQDARNARNTYAAHGLSALGSVTGAQIHANATMAAAGAGANAQRNLMEALGNAPEGSALRKGFDLTKQEGRIPAMYQAYVTAATDPMKGEDFKRMYPDFQTYLAGMGGSGAGKFITLPDSGAANAPVLQRKN